jgi:hypothetical protein
LFFIHNLYFFSCKVPFSRNRKSDEEICAELREFVSLAGLPLKRMPSLKVLSDNGRFVNSSSYFSYFHFLCAFTELICTPFDIIFLLIFFFLHNGYRKDLAKVIKKRGYKNFSNLFLSSVTEDEVEENSSDRILEDEDVSDEDGSYRFTISSYFV